MNQTLWKRILGFIVLAAMLGALGTPASVAAEALHQAQVIVQLAPGRQEARTVEFSGEISGLQALQLTGLDVTTADYGWGTAVCAIEDVGCPASDCFCDNNAFWSYSRKGSNGWETSMMGAASTTVGDGAVEGWRWSAFSDPRVALPAPETFTAAQDALAWLQTQQSAQDGGYGSMGSTSDTLLAVGANGGSLASWKKADGSPALMPYLMKNAAAYVNQGADRSGKIAIGLAGAADGCWPFGAKQPQAQYNLQTGKYVDSSYGQALAILGTLSLGQAVPAEAVTWLKSQVDASGGWEYTAGWGVDTNTTALVVQALIGAGEASNSAVITNALAYLKTTQQDDGGFPYNLDSTYGAVTSDADSTAFVIQAALAAGQDPASPAWTRNAQTPVDFLTSLQLADGSLEWQKGLGSNLLATQQAIPALLYRSMPFDATLAACPTIHLPMVARDQP